MRRTPDRNRGRPGPGRRAPTRSGARRRGAPAAFPAALVTVLLAAACLAGAGAGCGEPGASQAGGDAAAEDPARAAPARPERDTVEVKLGTERFELELALEPAARHRGLGGRDRIDPRGGMLFVFPRPRVLEFVMRDCRVPLDLAFLDGRGRVVAIHAMDREPPRRPGESAGDYEARLPGYTSVLPARFAVEVAAGRLRDAGLLVGDRVALDVPALTRRAR